MNDRRKIIYDFLPETDRQNLSDNLQVLKQLKNTEYNIIVDKNEIIDGLSKLTNYKDPLILQIIAHGNCDGFGLDRNNLILYSEISDVLRLINKSTNNKLIINLMTVCSSLYQLSLFNQGQERLFEILVGCAKGTFVNGAILHSENINTTLLSNLKKRIDDINYDLDDDYSTDRNETLTYMIIN